jgi:hypothetical protein
MSSCIYTPDFHGSEYEDYHLLDVTTYNLLCEASTFWRNLSLLVSGWKADHEDGVPPESNKKPSKKSVRVL